MSVAELGLVDEGIPRRLSVRNGDLAYDDRAFAFSDRIAVFLDGVEQPEVTAWDVDEGAVVVILHHENGAPMLDSNGFPAWKERRGRVEVRWLASPHPGGDKVA